MRTTILVLMLGILAGCSTTSAVGYRNPAIPDYKLAKKVAVFVETDNEAQTQLGDTIGERIAAALQARGIEAVSTATIQRFTPALDARLKKIQATGAASLLVVRYRDSKHSRVDTIDFGSAISGTENSATVTHNAVPVGNIDRYLSADVGLWAIPVKTKDDEAVWRARLSTDQSGLLFVGDNNMLGRLSDALLSALEHDALIDPAPRK